MENYSSGGESRRPGGGLRNAHAVVDDASSVHGAAMFTAEAYGDNVPMRGGAMVAAAIIRGATESQGRDSLAKRRQRPGHWLRFTGRIG